MSTITRRKVQGMAAAAAAAAIAVTPAVAAEPAPTVTLINNTDPNAIIAEATFTPLEIVYNGKLLILVDEDARIRLGEGVTLAAAKEAARQMTERADRFDRGPGILAATLLRLYELEAGASA